METSIYDTSVLIEKMRDGVTELQGFTTILNLIEFPKALTIKGLDIIIPGKDDYDRSFEISILLLESGTPIPTIDIVLAAVAINRGLNLETRDRHFEYVHKILPKFRLRIV